jgi:spermidine synthase
MIENSAAFEDVIDRTHGRLLERIENGSSAFEVREDERYRWIQSADGTLHTLMDRSSPERLLLPYSVGMMAGLLFADALRSVLMPGLGGGSQARFLRYHFADTRITAWESHAGVIDVARRHFCLRENDDGLRIVNEDARTGLAAEGPTADLILVDLFGARGMPHWVRERDVHTHCRRRLAEGGVAVTNLWVDADDEFLEVMDGVQRAFDGRTLVICVPGYRNLVVLAFKSTPSLDFASLRERAVVLGERTSVDYLALIEAMRESNFSDERGFVL